MHLLGNFGPPSCCVLQQTGPISPETHFTVHVRAVPASRERRWWA